MHLLFLLRLVRIEVLLVAVAVGAEAGVGAREVAEVVAELLVAVEVESSSSSISNGPECFPR